MGWARRGRVVCLLLIVSPSGDVSGARGTSILPVVRRAVNDLAQDVPWLHGAHPERHRRVDHDVRDLVEGAGFNITGVDWSNIHPYWLVVVDEQIIGCMQVCPGRPVGRLELLAVDPELTHRQRAETVKTLLTTGIETLNKGGSKIAMSMVSFKQKSFKKLLKKRGAVVVSSGNMLAIRI